MYHHLEQWEGSESPHELNKIKKQNGELKELLQTAIEGNLTTKCLVDSMYLINGGSSREELDDFTRKRLQKTVESK